VYQKNKKSIAFYLKFGFVIDDSCVDEATGEAEYIMSLN
jgi:hypothetical protein